MRDRATRGHLKPREGEACPSPARARRLLSRCRPSLPQPSSRSTSPRPPRTPTSASLRSCFTSSPIQTPEAVPPRRSWSSQPGRCMPHTPATGTPLGPSSALEGGHSAIMQSEVPILTDTQGEMLLLCFNEGRVGIKGTCPSCTPRRGHVLCLHPAYFCLCSAAGSGAQRPGGFQQTSCSSLGRGHVGPESVPRCVNGWSSVLPRQAQAGSAAVWSLGDS